MNINSTVRGACALLVLAISSAGLGLGQDETPGGVPPRPLSEPPLPIVPDPTASQPLPGESGSPYIPETTPPPALTNPVATTTNVPTLIVGPKTMTERALTKQSDGNGDPGALLDLRLCRQLRSFAFKLDLDTPEQFANPVIYRTLPDYPEVLDKHLKIPSIHEVINDPRYYNPGSNEALIMELTYLNWGATTGAQTAFRHGDYYTATIANNGHSRALTVVFQFRQINTHEAIRTLTQKLPRFSGGARAYFAVIGPPYLNYGPVSSWRMLVLDGETIVAKEQSAIW